MLARKTNLLDNLTDVFAHLWIRSDLVIRSKKRTLECIHCSGFSHTKRSCPQLHYKEKISYDEMVESYFVYINAF
jgi:hypothetical protein